MKSAVFAAAALLALGCAATGSVTRVADGTRQEGRYIDTVAYSDYAQAALLEAAGKLPAALEAYEAALDSDDESAEIWTRIGAVRCRLALDARKSGAEPALAAFRRALDLDPTFAPAHAERATCLEELGRKAEALEAALEAVRHDPERVELSSQVARLLFAAGRAADAWAWLDALITRQPSSARAWQSFARAAEQQRDAGRLQRAQRAEQALGLVPHESAAKPKLSSDAIDTLLLAGDLKAARAVAIAHQLRPSALAVRAAELGVLDVAIEQGTLVLRADPDDSDAWVALLYASQRAGTAEQFQETLRAQGAEQGGLSPAAAALFERVLEQRAGREAARSFRDAYAVAREERAQ